MDGDEGGFDGGFDGDFDGDFDQEGFDDGSFDESDESMSLDDSGMEPTIDESVLDSMVDDYNSQKESDEEIGNETDEVSDESDVEPDIESDEISDENLEGIVTQTEVPEEPLVVTEEKIEESEEDNQELSIEDKETDTEPKVTFSEPYMKVSEAGIDRCLDSTGHIRAKEGEKLPGNDPEMQRHVIDAEGVLEYKKPRIDEVSEEELEEVNELDKEPEEMEARAEYRHWHLNKGNEVLDEVGQFKKEWKAPWFKVPRHYEQEPKLTHDGEKYMVSGSVTADTSAFNSVDFRRLHPEIFQNEHWKYQRIFDDVFDMATSHAAINDAEGKQSMERRFNELVKFEFGDKMNSEIENLGSNNPKTVERATEKLNLLERNLMKAKQLWIDNAFKE